METKNARRPAVWTQPALAYRGTVAEVLRGGEGKQSTSPYDPGEYRCPPADNKCGRGD